MTPAPLHVLLLGWNDAPRAGELPVPALRPLVSTLAARAALSVVVPHQPQPAIDGTATTRVTSLTDLTPAEARAPRPDQRPAAWQRPVAPYVGTADEPAPAGASGSGGSWTAPAAPYQGATPDLAGAAPNAALPNALSLPGLEERPAVVDQRAAHQAVQASIATAVEATEAPASEEAALQEMVSATAAELSQPTTAAPTPPNQPARTTLTEALAALGVDLPPNADLNFQVIQYARFATRRALLEDFAVIYAADWPTWLAALEIRQQTGRPLVLHVHSLAQERATPADRGWALELERLALRRADKVLAASDEVAHLLRVRYNVAPERLQLVAPTDTTALNTVLHQLEHSLTGRQPVVPFFPPTA